MSAAEAALDRLGTIRQRCARVTAHVGRGASAHFTVDRARLPVAVDATVAATRGRYPSLRIPPHSRWRHFDAGDVRRTARLDAALAARSPADAARARFDLAVVSVLLDAGAGPQWRYREPSTGLELARSEGLAVATFDAFMDGAFSADARDPLRVDAAMLARCDRATLGRVFQVSERNPLVGLEGRAAMLGRLAASVDGGRPARWFDALTGHGEASHVDTHELFAALRNGLRFVLPGGLVRDRAPLGDCWMHAAVGVVPFHKLTQWLAYSLLEPLHSAGVSVTQVEALTGLPEYRNGGLLLDTGVLQLRDPLAAQRTHAVDSPLVVEWRALTVTLLDDVAGGVRAALGRPDLPLASVLEGGTWAAGRALAQGRAGRPPLTVESDGTVF